MFGASSGLPFIISLFTLIMVRGSLLYGSLILLTFGLGHSIIFIVFSAFWKQINYLTSKLRSNRIINTILGVLLIVLALVFLGSIISPALHMNH